MTTELKTRDSKLRTTPLERTRPMRTRALNVVVVMALVLGLAGMASAFSISTNQDIDGPADIVGDGPGDNTVTHDATSGYWEWKDRDGNNTDTAVADAGLDLQGYRILTNGGQDINLDLNGGGITGTNTTAISTLYSGGTNPSADVRIINVGTIAMGGIDARVNTYGRNPGSVTLGQSGTPVAGDIRVDFIYAYAIEYAPYSYGNHVTVYGTGDVLIQNSDGSVKGEIRTSTERKDAGNILVVHDGSFAAGTLDTQSNGNQDGAGNSGYITLNGDANSDGADGTFECLNIRTFNDRTTYGADCGNVSISGYQTVDITGYVLGRHKSNDKASDVTVSAEGDITLGSYVDLSASNVSQRGVLSLTSTGANGTDLGQITVATLDCDDFEYAAFTSFTNTTVVTGDLLNFDASSMNLRTPDGQTIKYDPFAAGNGYLGLGTYDIPKIDGTAGLPDSGVLAPDAVSYVYAAALGTWTAASFDGGAATAAQEIAQFGTPGIGDLIPAVSGTVTVGAIRFQDENVYDLQDGGTGLVQLQGASGGSAFIVAASASVDHTVSVNLSLVTDLRVDTQVSGQGVTIAGDISGAGNLVKAGAGTLTLSGTNTIGATTVSEGTLNVTGDMSGSSGIGVEGSGQLTGNGTVTTITVQSGATYSGSFSGTMTELSIGNGGTMAPGASVGTLAVPGDGVWAGLGTYEWEINDATGTAGVSPGWDLTTYTGSLDISATSGSKFTVELVTLSGASSGEMLNFSPTTNYSWTIATTVGGVTNFDASKFTLGLSGMQNSAPGTFSIGQSGDDIVLSYAAATAHEVEVGSNSPIAWWRLGESSGTTADNEGSIGSAVDGTYVGGVALGQPSLLLSDMGNTSAYFDGSNDLVTIPDHDDINLVPSFTERTIEMWLKAEDVASRQVIYEEGGGTHGMGIYTLGGKIYLGVWTDAGATMSAFASGDIEADQVYHLVMSFDSDNALVGYLNGVAFDTITAGLSPMLSHSGDIGIGAMSAATFFHDTGADGGTFGWYFQGWIDEFAIYDTALSAEDVLALYSTGMPVAEPAGLGLIGLALLGMKKKRSRSQASAYRRSRGVEASTPPSSR
jgi:autotransporter-associated beta strand protein